MPIGIGNGVNVQQPVFPALLFELWAAGVQQVSVNAAVNNHMCHVYPLRSPVACHGLRQRTQGRFGRGKRTERRAALNRGGRTGKNNGSPAAGNHAPASFPTDQKAPQAAHPPDHLKELGFGLQQRLGKVIPRIIHHAVQHAVALVLRNIKQTENIRLPSRIRHHSGRGSTVGLNALHENDPAFPEYARQ